MKQFKQSFKSLLATMVLLCICMTAAAETVEINGVFYDLQNGWSSYYYDSNGNYQSGTYYERAALVTYDHSLDWSVNNRETYQGDVVIPDKVTKDGVEYPVVAVDYSTFQYCKSLTSVQLPSSVVKINGNAFYECSALTSVTMTGVQVLEGSDIFNYTKITSLTFPKTLKSFNSSLFRNMSNLTSITIEEGSEVYKSVDGVLYDKNITKIVGYPAKKGGNYTIPATITTVSSGSFPDNVSIDELIVPATVTKIENNAFGYSPQIKKLTLEDGDAELTIGTGNNSTYFYDDKGSSFEIYPMFCNTLSELYWGRPLKYSSAYSSPFAQSNLNKVTFGPIVSFIPKYTFFNCWGLNTVDVKGGIGQWCNFDFTDLYTSPFSCYDGMKMAMPGEEVIEPIVTFDGKELRGVVVIPDEVTSIPSHGFQYGCSGITELTIPAGVTSIADGAFKGLSSLSTIQLAMANTNFVVDDNVLYDIDKTKILCFPQLRAGDYTMPETITEMGDYQFYNCINLTGVTLSSKIKTIGQYAFANCTKLPAITIPAMVETIGQYAFANCEKLTSITIPASVKAIKNYAFENCTGITNVVIEDSDSPLELGMGSVYKQEYVIDPNYPDMGWYNDNNYGLFGFSPLKTLYIGRNLTLSNFSDSGSSMYGSSNYYYLGKGTLTRVEIGSKVTGLPAGLFKNNTCSINEVNYDGTITDWCNITFADATATPFYCSNAILHLQGSPLHSQVNIPEGATKIGAYSFYGQHGVSSIIVPSTVTTIEPYAFNNGFISEIYINAKAVIALTNTNSFTSNTSIFIVDEAVPDYKADATWSLLIDQIYPKGFLQVTVDLVAMTSSPALLPALNALEQVNGEYRITALTNLKIRGTMNGWDILMIRNKMPNLRTLDLSEATILDNDGGYEYYQGYHTTANTISSYSFYNLTNLRKVVLPQNITSIDYNAFYGCSNLQEVLDMPESCTRIGSSAFANSGLTSIIIGEGVRIIEGSAFENCSSLRDVTMGKNVKTISWAAFSNCYNLSNLTLVKGLETIESGAFLNCNSLRNLVFPTTLRRIESGAFQYCSSLTNIDFAEGLEYIGGSAFNGCSNLKNLHLPTSLRNIESSAFQYCTSLSDVHVPSMLQQIGDNAFTGCGLRSVYAYTVTPIQINQNTFDYAGVDLFAPANSFYAYYLNTQWSQFQDVKEFEALYTNWYTARNTDIEINVQKPIKNEDDNNPADGEMEPGSGLIFVGDGEQLVKKLILNWNHGDNYPSLIENGNLSVDELAFIMNVYPGRWYFFSFPFDVKLKNIKHDGKWVWRYYDADERAKSGSGGWKNVETDVLKANVGYIFQCNTAGDLELPVDNPDFFSQSLARKKSGAADPLDKNVGLLTYESKNPQDASWNFVGNPNLSYYSLDDMAEDFDAPITVWDPDQQTYTAVVPGDDEFDFHPFQAFFVQKPADNDDMTFRADNRATYNQAQKKAEARRKARATRAVDEKRMIINVEISNGTATDKTRVVFDDSKSLDYEIGTDANKMMSMSEVPQVYTLDNKNVKYAVNNRPNKDNEVRLGFSAPADGNYTISAPRMDLRMALKDNTTGSIHNFSNGAYTFQAEAGSNDTRFALVPATDTTGISEEGIDGLDIVAENGGLSVNGITDQTVSVYNVRGIRVATLTASGNVSLPNGTYIVSTGDKTSKILVK